jgi:hypothetical protein
MNAETTLTIPTAAEIAKRMGECRAELASLRRLYRLARAAEQAEQARRLRTRKPPPQLR